MRGHGLCPISRVHRRKGHSTRVDVEVARDLSTRSFGRRKIVWRKVEREG